MVFVDTAVVTVIEKWNTRPPFTLFWATDNFLSTHSSPHTATIACSEMPIIAESDELNWLLGRLLMVLFKNTQTIFCADILLRILPWLEEKCQPIRSPRSWTDYWSVCSWYCKITHWQFLVHTFFSAYSHRFRRNSEAAKSEELDWLLERLFMVYFKITMPFQSQTNDQWMLLVTPDLVANFSSPAMNHHRSLPWSSARNSVRKSKPIPR